MVREKKNIRPGQGKVTEFYFESRKNDIFKKRQGKLKLFNTAGLLPLMAGKNIWGQNFFIHLIEQGKFVENLSVLNQWKGQL